MVLCPYTAERRDVLGNTPPEAREISQGRGFCNPIFSPGSVREIHSLGKYFSVHSLGHREYQEIHTFSALNIDSVKINTSLLMMRE